MNICDSALTCPKCGDELPWPNRPQCSRTDCPERPGAMAMEVLGDFRKRIAEATKEPNPAWLIEIAPPIGDTLYYCDEGDWCNNPNHAWRFATKAEAEAKQSTMRQDLTRVAEHEWCEPITQPSREEPR